MEPGLRIRRAQPDEADHLTDLIMRSKAHWGYDAALLELWRADLTLDPDIIARDPVYCAEGVESGLVVGVSHFYRRSTGEVELDHLFVDPVAMGRGIGSLLWHHAVEHAAVLGAQAIVLGADPNARPFYERMGAVVVGWNLSSTVPGRRTPRMRYDLPLG